MFERLGAGDGAGAVLLDGALEPVGVLLERDDVSTTDGAHLFVKQLAEQFDTAVLVPVDLLDVLEELLGEHRQVRLIEPGLREHVDHPRRLHRRREHLGQDRIDVRGGTTVTDGRRGGELEQVCPDGEQESDVGGELTDQRM